MVIKFIFVCPSATSRFHYEKSVYVGWMSLVRLIRFDYSPGNTYDIRSQPAVIKFNKGYLCARCTLRSYPGVVLMFVVVVLNVFFVFDLVRFATGEGLLW